MEIIRGFANLPKITLSTCGKDDDVFVDRLNYKYTTLILFVSSITITVKILQSDHIQCWVCKCFINIKYTLIYIVVNVNAPERDSNSPNPFIPEKIILSP
jgi:hypothetical protein